MTTRPVMDAKGMLRYGTVTMRLLLLLSALFAALAGSTGTRAAAQPVQASAVAAAAIAVTQAPMPIRANHPAEHWSYHRPAVALLQVYVAAPGQPPIFASRRRE